MQNIGETGLSTIGPLHSKLGCFLFSIGSSNSSTTLHGGHVKRQKPPLRQSVSMVTGCFANESFRQRSFRKRLWSVRKRVEVSSQFLGLKLNVTNIYMSTQMPTWVLTIRFRTLHYMLYA